MSDLIDRQAAIEVIDAVFPVDPMKSEYAQGIACGAALAKTYVEQLPSVQSDRELIEQLKWERDTAIQQLKDLGYGLGEKPKTDDTISRQDAIDTVLTMFDRCDTGEITDYRDLMVESFKVLPSQERKKGKWISDSDDDPVVIEDGFPDKSCYCSECREWLVASDEYAVKGNFCPNCGADMRGEGHE